MKCTLLSFIAVAAISLLAASAAHAENDCDDKIRGLSESFCSYYAESQQIDSSQTVVDFGGSLTQGTVTVFNIQGAPFCTLSVKRAPKLTCTILSVSIQ